MPARSESEIAVNDFDVPLGYAAAEKQVRCHLFSKPDSCIARVRLPRSTA